MNRLEIFQKVYGADHVFTVQELERLRQVTELIIQECADRIKNELHSDPNENEPVNDFGDGYNAGIYSAIRAIKDHFGIK